MFYAVSLIFIVTTVPVVVLILNLILMLMFNDSLTH